MLNYSVYSLFVYLYVKVHLIQADFKPYRIILDNLQLIHANISNNKNESLKWSFPKAV